MTNTLRHPTSMTSLDSLLEAVKEAVRARNSSISAATHALLNGTPAYDVQVALRPLMKQPGPESLLNLAAFQPVGTSLREGPGSPSVTQEQPPVSPNRDSHSARANAFDPEVELKKLDIAIQYIELPDVMAAWDPDQRRVYCHKDLTSTQKRCVLTHQLAHVTLGHRQCVYANEELESTVHIMQERTAELWASRKLITAVQLATAQESDLQTHQIARELKVTPRVYRARLLAEKEDERHWLA